MIDIKKTTYLPIRSRGGVCGFTKIDIDDYERLKNFKLSRLGRSGYLQVGLKHNGTKYFHRIVLETPVGMITDHINGDRLDNRRSNLRIVNDVQNSMNRGFFWNKKTKGVFLMKDKKRRKPWLARIGVSGKNIYLGNFCSEREAADCYDVASMKYFGEFAKTNEQMRKESLCR